MEHLAEKLKSQVSRRLELLGIPKRTRWATRRWSITALNTRKKWAPFQQPPHAGRHLGIRRPLTILLISISRRAMMLLDLMGFKKMLWFPERWKKLLYSRLVIGRRTWMSIRPISLCNSKKTTRTTRPIAIRCRRTAWKELLTRPLLCDPVLSLWRIFWNWIVGRERSRFNFPQNGIAPFLRTV